MDIEIQIGKLLTLVELKAEKLERIENRLAAGGPSPAPLHLNARQAAEYLGIPYSTFRKKAVRIRRSQTTGRYRREDLDEFAASARPKRKR